jgi:hypothetical protein
MESTDDSIYKTIKKELHYLKKGYSVSLEGDNMELKKTLF